MIRLNGGALSLVAGRKVVNALLSCKSVLDRCFRLGFCDLVSWTLCVALGIVIVEIAFGMVASIVLERGYDENSSGG